MTDKDFVLSIHPHAFEFDKDDCDNIHGIYMVLNPCDDRTSMQQARPLGWGKYTQEAAWANAAELLRKDMLRRLER